MLTSTSCMTSGRDIATLRPNTTPKFITIASLLCLSNRFCILNPRWRVSGSTPTTGSPSSTVHSLGVSPERNGFTNALQMITVGQA
jgi:hypothetical protein